MTTKGCRTQRPGPSFLLALSSALVLAVAPALASDDAGASVQGAVEVLYRSVSVDGSDRKYDEDFDGLDSGVRLGTLSLDWTSRDSRILDHLRLDLSGLGGDPAERSALRLGRKDAYDLRIGYTKQTYIYDLFELVANEDGATWDAERRRADIDLRVYPATGLALVFGFQQGRRTGTSLFMKDISRDVFRLETPLAARMNRYTVGADIKIGPVDLLIRQTLRRYDNQFDNHAEGDLGLDLGNQTRLDLYDWRQNDSGSTDWTSVRVRTPIGERVELTVSALGTFAGDDELRSEVRLEQRGIAFNGTPFGGTCAASATSCSTDAQCAAIVPGDVCRSDIGTSRADLEGDTMHLGADISVDILEPLALILQYRSLDRELSGRLSRDLDGNGVPEDPDGDGERGSRIRNDYEIQTATALVDYRPVRQARFRLGFRHIERDLTRDGMGGLRDLDYDSGNDRTLLAGVTLKPVKWLSFAADYEDGDLDQPFNAVAASESRHLRARAALVPRDGTRIDLSYLDIDRRNTESNIREPGRSWDARFDGRTWSVALWHRFNERVDVTLRRARQQADSRVGITFDQAGFAAIERGDSIFDNDNTQLSGQINFSWADPWKAYARAWSAKSEGENLVLGNVTGVVNDEPIDQRLLNLEAGLVHTFASGLFVGGSIARFDYSDANGRLEYDGTIFTIRVGTSF